MANYSVNVSYDDYKKASKKSSNQLEDLYKELESLNEEYEKKGQGSKLPEFDLPDKMELDRLDTDKKEEAELKKQAEIENSGLYDEQKNKLQSQTESNKKKLEEMADSTLQASQEQQNKIDKLYEERKQSASDQALRRGLARSSIIMGQLESFDREKIDSKLNVDADTRKQLQNIQTNIDELGIQLQKAKDDLDIKLQEKIQKRMLELIDEQETRYINAIKYNNDQNKRETDYLQDREKALLNRAKTQAQLEQDKSYYGSELGQRELLEKKFTAIQSYLSKMDKKDAMNLLNNDSVLKNNLGSYYAMMRMYLESK